MEHRASRVICTPGPRVSEARLHAELRAEISASREDPARLGSPLRVLVPSETLRQQLSAGIARELGAVAGLVVQTLRSAARECIARSTDRVRSAELLAPMVVRRSARAEPALRLALDPLEDGYAAVSGAVDDLLDAGLDAISEEAVLEALAELPPGRVRERAAAVVRVARSTDAALEAHGLAHRSRLFRVAGETLGADPRALEARAVFVYGVADATGVLLDFIEALVRERDARVLVDVPGDPADAARPAPGSGFVERLTGRLAGFGVEQAARPPDGPAPSQVRPEVVHWCRAAGAQGEVRFAARRIRALLDGGQTPERIAIVMRDPVPYRTALATGLRRFAVPFSGIDGFLGRDGRKLRALVTLLERGGACPADVWLDARELEREGGDLRLALHGIGVARLADLAALDLDASLGDRGFYPLPVRRLLPSDPDSGSDEMPLRRGLGRPALERAVRLAARTLARVDQPSGPSTPGVHLRALHELVWRDLGWPAESGLGARFRRAVAKLEEELPADVRFDWSEFVLLLRRAVGDDGVVPLGGGGAGVQVLSVTDARACSFDHVFLLGLHRDGFPRAVSDDAILPDAIRERIANVLLDLPIKRRGHDEDRYLFAQLFAAAPHFTGSWQAVSDDGKERARSPLVERLDLLCGVEAETAPSAIDEVDEVEVDEVEVDQVAVDELLPPQERAVLVGLRAPAGAQAALAAALPGPDAARVAAHRHAALRELEGVGARRNRLGPFLGLVGRTSDGDLREGPMYVTRLEGLHYCPWQTFLQRVLRLKPLPDALAALPDLSPLVVGNVMHEALHRIVAESGVPSGEMEDLAQREPVHAAWPSAARVDALVLEAARQVARDEGVLLAGYARFLARVVRPHVERIRELDWADGPPAVVGAESAGEAWLPGFDRPLRFRADRVDRAPGGGLVFTDYKGGKPISDKIKPETRRAHLESGIRSGQRLQAATYAAAAGPEGEGRYLFSRPGLADAHANVPIAGDDAAAQEQLVEAVGMGWRAWDQGYFVPRLVDGKGNDGRSCEWCELQEACVQGDSSMRRRLRERMAAVADRERDGDEHGDRRDVERGVYALWGEA